MEFISEFKELISVLGLIGVIYGLKNYRRKSGIHVRGNYCISEIINAEDKYISNITLENFKDRSVIIFKIFIRVGHNYYIEMDDFESEPKILKSYESLTFNYQPVDFYSLNLQRVKLNKILNSRHSKIRIVLSTSQGKYVVKKFIKQWDPIFEFFKNHMTACIVPMHPLEKTGHYGTEFKYLVKLTTEDGYTNTIPVYTTDINHSRFGNFELTSEAISSSENLHTFLLKKAFSGHLKCTAVEVIDAEQLRRKNYGHTYAHTFEATHFNWFTYKVMGRIGTIYSNLKLKIQNRKLRKKR